MRQFFKLIYLLLKTELRNRQAVMMTIFFPVILMGLMGVAGSAEDREGLTYMTYLMPGILIMSYGATGLITLPIMISSYKERNILKKIFLAPITKFKFISALFTTQLLFMLLQTIIIFAVAVFVFKVELSSSISLWWMIIPIFIFGNLALLGIGLFIASIVSSSKNASIIGNLTNLILIFLGGGFFPAESWPNVLQPLIKILPTTYMVEGIRKILLFNTETLVLLAQQLTALILIGFIAIFSGLYKLSWK